MIRLAYWRVRAMLDKRIVIAARHGEGESIYRVVRGSKWNPRGFIEKPHEVLASIRIVRSQ